MGLSLCSGLGSQRNSCPFCTQAQEEGGREEDVYWSRIHSTSFQYLPPSPVAPIYTLMAAISHPSPPAGRYWNKGNRGTDIRVWKSALPGAVELS